METILLADDNDAARGVTREMVENAGYRVLEAAGTEEALELARRQRIDILITDLVMPDGDGLGLAVSVSLIHPHVRVLHTSAYADMRWTGSFIAKPFTSAELIDALNQLVAA